MIPVCPNGPFGGQLLFSLSPHRFLGNFTSEPVLYPSCLFSGLKASGRPVVCWDECPGSSSGTFVCPESQDWMVFTSFSGRQEAKSGEEESSSYNPK